MDLLSIRERHDEFVRLLRRRSGWTTDQLADELGVSRRTIMRDVGELRERGFDISAMTGPGGGLQLEPSAVLVTSQLQGDEVVALILSVALVKATPWMPFASPADEALKKIEAALPHQRVAELQQVTQRIMIGEPQLSSEVDIGPIDGSLVPTFEASFTQCRLLQFRYTNASGRSTRRRVEPHGLLVRAPLWYVIAWDPKPDAPRLFRADRIRAPKVDAEGFVPRPHDLVTGVCPDARPADPR